MNLRGYNVKGRNLCIMKLLDGFQRQLKIRKADEFMWHLQAEDEVELGQAQEVWNPERGDIKSPCTGRSFSGHPRRSSRD